MTAPTTIDQKTRSTTGISIADARFISLVTFRRTGEPVATPVLFAIDGDRLLVRTAHDAGKLKRLGHTSRVEVAPATSEDVRWGRSSQARLGSSGRTPSDPHSPSCTASTGSSARSSPHFGTSAARAT